MKTRDFLSKLDEAKIVAEIAAAEARTSGEIRVFVSAKDPADALARAKLRFQKLGMARTRERNAVLLYFAPRAQKFAVVGDIAIHEKCGPAFWEEIVTDIRERLRAEQVTGAVTHAVHKAGEMLARHFPATPDDRDELPDEIVGD
jgi:uncharacterized membrane protein